MTQSAVSHAISGLEADLGLILLHRDRSGIRLTDNGKRMLKYVREILHLDERMRQEAAAIRGLETRTVRIEF